MFPLGAEAKHRQQQERVLVRSSPGAQGSIFMCKCTCRCPVKRLSSARRFTHTPGNVPSDADAQNVHPSGQRARGKCQKLLPLPECTITTATDPNLVLPCKKISAPQCNLTPCQPLLWLVHQHSFSQHQQTVREQREAAK